MKCELQFAGNDSNVGDVACPSIRCVSGYIRLSHPSHGVAPTPYNETADAFTDSIQRLDANSRYANNGNLNGTHGSTGELAQLTFELQ